MSSKWTNEQTQAIDARDTAIIVSAAAGSGKTSVLVERLVRQLASENPKIPADRLIVVTFTNDAATEMKQRLTAALSELMEANPENEWLCEQQSLIQSANISTIHSFCINLIRENIQSLDISSGFRIIDENEQTILLKKAYNSVIENYCSQKPQVLKSLTDFFCSKGDFQLEDAIMGFYNFVISIPYYEDWLKEQQFQFSDSFDFKNSKLKRIYLGICEDFLLNMIQEAEKAKILCEDISADKAYNLLNLEQMAFSRIKDKISDETIEWDERMSEFGNIMFDRMPSAKFEKDSQEKEIYEQVKKIRGGYKNKFTKFTSEMLFSEEEIEEDRKFSAVILAHLIDFIKEFESEYTTLKIERNGITFSDAETMTIKLLSEKNENGDIVKTKLAEELSEFYKIIMIDEFQDANNAQDLIFKMLSHNGTKNRNGDNVFVVGDVKQSIYRFRLANPAIFMDTLEKSEKYTDDFNGKNAYIKLNKNFRSSKDVIDFSNFIFSNIMSPSVGEVEYNDEEMLVQGATYPEKDRKTEILLINTEKETQTNNTVTTDDEEENQEENKEELNKEAYFVALKIKQMLEEKVMVTIKGEERPCIPSDFCILLRGRAQGVLYTEALKKFGIRAHTDEVEGYLKSREIAILINLLKIIDNPLLDISLASVLMSPMFMIDAEEIARLRLFSKEESLYKALCLSIGVIENENSKEKPDENASYFKKAEYFYNTLKTLRNFSAGYSLEKLIRTIYDNTDFLSVVQIYKDGEQKKANLQLLINHAKTYEENQNGGLSGFLRYINSVSENGGDLHRAGIVSSSDDVVSVKTIHKSKGLEFPFVFLCRTGVKFNNKDLYKQIQLSLSDGIAFKIREKDKLKYYTTLPYVAVREQNKRNSMSEEMRLLYVALTRAKEKLFITMDINSKSIEKIKSIAKDIRINGKITPRIASKAECMQDWLTAALLYHKDGDFLRNLADENIINFDVNEQSSILVTECNENAEEDLTKKENEIIIRPEPDKNILKEITENINFEYNKKYSEIPSKLTVSEISKQEHDILLKRPKFVESNKALTGAEKGTAIHTFMQYSDYKRDEDDIKGEIDRLVSTGILTKAQAESIDIYKLNQFFKSSLYSRIKKSDNVMRERKFLMKISDIKIEDELIEIYKDTDGMLQGIADCIFEENDGLVLVDYKTDYIKSEEELTERYSKQLKFYKYCLDEISEKKVKEIYLYSFCLNTQIKL